MVTTRAKPTAAGAGAASATRPRALVTGGSGFLGRHIVAALLESGQYQAVRVFDVRVPQDADARAEYVVGDLRQPADVRAACDGIDVVFHVATAAPTAANAANRALMHAVNVDGTAHILAAAAAAGVRALVYTSSASVVFDGRDLVGADESTPYAARPMDYYTGTKMEGEQLVLAANGRGGLATVALRPSGIFGEHDALTIPTIADQARKGKMKYIIGDGSNVMDWTYAGNVAEAHLLAADALAGGPQSKAAGKAYFITNDDPRPFWGFMGDVCQGLGYPRPSIKLPFWLVYFIALVMQYVIVPLLRPIKALQTNFTPFRVTLASVNRKFSCAAARRDLGYVPRVGVDEALKRTLAFYPHLRAGAAPPTAAEAKAK